VLTIRKPATGHVLIGAIKQLLLPLRLLPSSTPRGGPAQDRDRPSEARLCDQGGD
jgi:hypothetical protein